MNDWHLSETSATRLATTCPTMQAIVMRALELSDIDFGVAEGLRSAERQKELFDAGLSKCDGYKLLSKHQTGNAADLYAYAAGKALWSKKPLSRVNRAMQQAAREILPQEGYSKLVWGGSWTNFLDAPHFELK